MRELNVKNVNLKYIWYLFDIGVGEGFLSIKVKEVIIML